MIRYVHIWSTPRGYSLCFKKQTKYTRRLQDDSEICWTCLQNRDISRRLKPRIGMGAYAPFDTSPFHAPKLNKKKPSLMNRIGEWIADWINV